MKGIDKVRKVFLDDLPKKYGFGKNSKKLVIDWKHSIGYELQFIYDSIEGNFVILDYNVKESKLKVKYNNDIKLTTPSQILSGAIGGIIGKYTKDFKYDVGQIIHDSRRNIQIIERAYKNVNGIKRKYYKYICLKCGYDCSSYYLIKGNKYYNEYFIDEGNLISGHGCACCCSSSQIVVEGINDIPTTAPWMVKYFQGGYDEAKKYTCQSNKKIYPVCPDCGMVKSKNIIINQIFNTHSIKCVCGDGFSYPEKLVREVLRSLNIEFKTQLSKLTFEWCDKYRYDFYFEYNNKQYIVETHGLQHYEDAFVSFGNSLNKEQENDRIKKELALNNGIKEENYIVIDCKYSSLEWIKNSIINSGLSKIFNLNCIDWTKCEELSLTNKVKEVCAVYASVTTNIQKIASIFNMEKSTIVKYLNKGSRVGWCNYNSKLAMIEGSRKVGKSKAIKIVCLNNKVIFNSASECEKLSMKYFNTTLSQSCINAVCRHNVQHIKGYVFRYLNEYLSMTDAQIKELTDRTYKIKHFKNPKKKFKTRVINVNTLEIFDSITEANKKYNTSKVGEVCSGNRKTAGGFRWMYYEEYLSQKNDKVV